MTNMRERGSRHQYLAAAAVVCASGDRQNFLFWQEKGILISTGSPP